MKNDFGQRGLLTAPVNNKVVKNNYGINFDLRKWSATFGRTLRLLVILAGYATCSGSVYALEIDSYRWEGGIMCTDCMSPGGQDIPATTMPGSGNYTGELENGIAVGNFAPFSYSYSGRTLSVSPDSTRISASIGGWDRAAETDLDTKFNLRWIDSFEQHSLPRGEGRTPPLRSASLFERGDRSGIQGEFHEPAHFYFDHRDNDGHTSPVPEREPYLMLMAGLGFLGFVARRRNYRAA
jgi:hypothetical protein